MAAASDDTRTCWAYGVRAAKAPTEKVDITLHALGATDVEAKVLFCGICHSDVHLNDGDWGPFSAFAHGGVQVSGHEIVGEVTKVGPAVTHLSVGDKIGVGWQRSACNNCEQCLRDDHNLCDQNEPTCAGGHNGGFAEFWRGDSRFAFKLPASIDLASAGPLLCGGITVYSPLLDHSKAGDRIGVVGIGGLGHLAVKFARTRGCHVTALSSSEDKRESVLGMGANSFINTSDPAQVKRAANSMDLIIVTVTVPLDWSPFVDMLRPRGTLCFVGAIQKPMELSLFGPLMMKNLKVAGSCIGGRGRMAHMLDFAATHDVRPIVEVVPVDQVRHVVDGATPRLSDTINEALDRVRENKARFRMVLQM